MKPVKPLVYVAVPELDGLHRAGQANLLMPGHKIGPLTVAFSCLEMSVKHKFLSSHSVKCLIALWVYPTLVIIKLLHYNDFRLNDKLLSTKLFCIVLYYILNNEVA